MTQQEVVINSRGGRTRTPFYHDNGLPDWGLVNPMSQKDNRCLCGVQAYGPSSGRDLNDRPFFVKWGLESFSGGGGGAGWTFKRCLPLLARVKACRR